jgi:peptidoglycan/LPS O-acetylase OafA/YrhL
MSGANTTRLDLRVLDSLRGAAAVYVLLHHASLVLWGPGAERAAGGAARPAAGLQSMLWSATSALSYGHEAVLLFFLVSGFCVHLRQARERAAGRPPLLDAWQFAWRRVRRLYPPLVFALLFTAACDLIGSRLAPALYSGHSTHLTMNGVLVGDDHYALTTIAGNLLMQGGLVVSQLGTASPLWSLALEVWFYALYPLLLPVATRWGARGILAAGVAMALLAAALRPLIGVDIPYHAAAPAPEWVLRVLTHWVVWCAGAAIAELYARSGRAPRLALLVPPALACLALAARGDRLVGTPGVVFASLGYMGRTYLWTFGLACLLAYVLVTPPGWLRVSIERVATRLRFAGDVSYSLYLTHYPLLALVCAWWLSGHDSLPTGGGLAAAGTVAAGVVAVGAWWLVERHFTSGRTSARGRSDPGTNLRPTAASNGLVA